MTPSKLEAPVNRQLPCCGNNDIQRHSGQRSSLAASSTYSPWAHLTSKAQRSQVQVQKHETWTWEQAQRILVKTRSLTFHTGTSDAFSYSDSFFFPLWWLHTSQTGPVIRRSHWSSFYNINTEPVCNFTGSRFRFFGHIFHLQDKCLYALLKAIQFCGDF